MRCAVLALVFLLAAAHAVFAQPTCYSIAHEVPDANFRTGDFQNLVLLDKAAPNGKLLLYIGGARNYASCPQKPFFDLALAAGYRVIALDWKYNPPGTSICPQSSDEFCFTKFRETKTFGIQSMPELEVTQAESLVSRTASLLRYLQQQHPDEGWGRYLTARGPVWEQIAVSGHSQASGMAAFLAKRERVARVILFSSPWDHFRGPPAHLASWLSLASATPMDRWYGAYHARETESAWLGQAYRALAVPHIRVFTLEPQHPAPRGDAYHFSVLGSNYAPKRQDGSFAYSDDWKFMLGSGSP